jgi:hypothetical protein
MQAKIEENKLKEILYHDYNLIKKMEAPDPSKIKLLSTLFSLNPNCWRVIGITPEAVRLFSKNSFQKKSGMGINRSHLIQRHLFYNYLLTRDFVDQNEFWESYYINDATILATSSENMSKNNQLLERAYLVPSDSRHLFHTSGFAWKHKKEEENFLRELNESLKKNKPITLLKESSYFNNIQMLDLSTLQK